MDKIPAFWRQTFHHTTILFKFGGLSWYRTSIHGFSIHCIDHLCYQPNFLLYIKRTLLKNTVLNINLVEDSGTDPQALLMLQTLSRRCRTPFGLSSIVWYPRRESNSRYITYLVIALQEYKPCPKANISNSGVTLYQRIRAFKALIACSLEACFSQ